MKNSIDLFSSNNELKMSSREIADITGKRQTKIKLPQTFAEALQLAANQAKQLELQAPKVESYGIFIDSKALQGFKKVANLLELGRNTMMKIVI